MEEAQGCGTQGAGCNSRACEDHLGKRKAQETQRLLDKVQQVIETTIWDYLPKLLEVKERVRQIGIYR